MTNHHDVKLSDYQALAEFRYQIRRFVHFSEEAAREAGVEPQHHQLMLAIKGKPDGEEPRIAYLAERLQIQHHSAVELVDRLVKKGLITRTRGDEDRREVHVQLTPRGERILTNSPCTRGRNCARPHQCWRLLWQSLLPAAKPPRHAADPG